MSAREHIAHHLAERFAPELGERLPVAVRRAIANEEGEESPLRSADPALIVAYAGFVVSLAGLAWNVYQGLAQARRAGGEGEALERENVVLRALLLARLEKEAPRAPALDEGVRARLLEAAAGAAVDEGARAGRGGAP